MAGPSRDAILAHWLISTVTDLPQVSGDPQPAPLVQLTAIDQTGSSGRFDLVFGPLGRVALRRHVLARLPQTSWGGLPRRLNALSSAPFNLIAELERDGHETVEARALLETFEELQAQHIADRDRLRREVND
jgi:hypothetical protein